MKISIILLFMLTLAVCLGCYEREDPPPARPLCEGVVWTLQWTDTNGKTHGMFRGSNPEGVPGGNGSWNMDLYARLYLTHIEIMNRQSPELGPMIVFSDKLDFVQFGDGSRDFTKE